jgi:hypothetical protein
MEQGGNAMVIFVNASPDSKPVDVYVNGKKELGGLAFGKPSESKNIAAGEAKIELKEGEKAILSTNARLNANGHYTIAAFGKAAEMKAQLIEAKHAAGKASVVVFHASPDAGTVDINVDGKPANKGLALGKWFDTSLGAGKHNFEVLAGSAEPALAKEWDLKPDTCTCLFVTGMAKGSPKLDFTVATHTIKAGTAEKAAPDKM